MKIRPLGAQLLFHAYRQTDMTKLIVFSQICEYALKNSCYVIHTILCFLAQFFDPKFTPIYIDISPHVFSVGLYL